MKTNKPLSMVEHYSVVASYNVALTALHEVAGRPWKFPEHTMARRTTKRRVVHEVDEDGLLSEARSSSSEKSFEEDSGFLTDVREDKVWDVPCS